MYIFHPLTKGATLINSDVKWLANHTYLFPNVKSFPCSNKIECLMPKIWKWLQIWLSLTLQQRTGWKSEWLLPFGETQLFLKNVISAVCFFITFLCIHYIFHNYLKSILYSTFWATSKLSLMEIKIRKIKKQTHYEKSWTSSRWMKWPIQTKHPELHYSLLKDQNMALTRACLSRLTWQTFS